MRPPEFTGGNDDSVAIGSAILYASMRPPEFTGGNSTRTASWSSTTPRFNEAAGIHRRKRRVRRKGFQGYRTASMRPPEFTGGNKSSEINSSIVSSLQ